MTEDWIAWVDLETTGLDAEENTILEIAVVVTDGHLRVKQMGPSIVIGALELWFDRMDPFVREMHTKNGLWDECLLSNVTQVEAENQVLQFLENIAERGTVPLGGSTISFDRAFLARWMPNLESWFHYRNIDVSSFKEIWKRWRPEVALPAKLEAHRAQDDIIESIEMLRFFHDQMMATSV